jgi:hypothetical protein
MKKIILFSLLFLICISVFAQNITGIYVKATGNDDNDGLTEVTAVKTLDHALFLIMWAGKDFPAKIIVIGVLDSSSQEAGRNSIFSIGRIYSFQIDREVLITGKQNATSSERAVLSAQGTQGISVFSFFQRTEIVRFEHIEISGVRSSDGNPAIWISGGAVVILGPGVIVKSNSVGAIIQDSSITSTLILDGGEIRDNTSFGVGVGKNGVLITKNGKITNNDVGAWIQTGGTLNQNGGIISGNNTNILR